MCDIGGEALDRFDARVERIGHIAQRARQITDFIAPSGKIGDFDAHTNPPADALRAVGEPSHRTGDGAGEQHRENHHDTGGHEKYFYDGKPFGFHHIVDIRTLCRQHQCAAHCTEALDRHRD